MKNCSSLANIILILLIPVLGTAQGIIIPSGAYIVSGGGNIVLTDNWVNNGSFVSDSGMVVFAGTTQSISGSAHTVFNNVTINSGSTTSVDSPGQSIKSILLNNGTLNANGNLTLLSTATRTALVDGSGTGDIFGDVTMQRYLDTGYGYKMISSPFQSATVGQLSSYIDLAASFPRFYGYTEDTNTTGWYVDTTAADTLRPMLGYAGNFGASFSSDTFSLHGVVNNGALSSTLYNHSNVYTQGYALVGNPYPSPIDWGASGGWTRTNIDNAIYYFNTSDTGQYYGTYSSYIGGVSSDGRTNGIVPAMQGFFVHVTDGPYFVTGTLDINNGARVNNLHPGYHKTAGAETPLIRLRAGFEDNLKAADPVVIYLNERNSRGFDKEIDALKMLNTEKSVPSLYALASDAFRLSIEALNCAGDSVSVVPLGLRTDKGGWVIFDGSDLEHLPGGMHVYLSDVQAHACQDLQANPRYRIRLDTGKYEQRFFLSFVPYGINKAMLSGEVFNAWSAGGAVFLDLYALSGGRGDAMITNMSGQVAAREKIDGYGHHIIPGPFVLGVYIISFVSNGEVHSKKIFIGAN
jgi:hypothetical protein